MLLSWWRRWQLFRSLPFIDHFGDIEPALFMVLNPSAPPLEDRLPLKASYRKISSSMTQRLLDMVSGGSRSTKTTRF